MEINGRMCFVEDDDGHWYLIPAYEKEEFEKVINMLYSDGLAYIEAQRIYDEKFYKRMCRNPRHYTFLDPKEN